MKIKELIEKLSEFDPEMELFISNGDKYDRYMYRDIDLDIRDIMIVSESGAYSHDYPVTIDNKKSIKGLVVS